MNSDTVRPRIENNNDMSCMMDEDKPLPEVCVTVLKKVATDYVQNDLIDDQEKSQSTDTENADDKSIPDIDRGSHEDEDCNHGVSFGSGSVGGHGCVGLSGFAIFSDISFREDGLGDGVSFGDDGLGDGVSFGEVGLGDGVDRCDSYKYS
ncbi:hypothetical protein Ddye_032336 [Dipteronia dyeriana]|uniref:Uncharacterized protein n=1 Tax=Dipteronia dyeriana TaxID=168575 RepID=A0AAD9WN49_9ROSI|nr:hypothetical protein Ddye_032336 [Dipteronia dyeriana]